MNRTAFIIVLGALALMGCSGDDEETPMDCGGDAGPVCPSGGSGGTGDAGGTSGGMGGAGGSGGAGGMGVVGGMGGSGGTAGVEPDDDGGVITPVEDASVPGEPLPDDGEQGAVCEDGVDCNQGLDCYNAGLTGQGFCTAACEGNEDCESIAGATFTCSMSTSLCFVECEGEDDTESCPDQMVCTNVAGFGGGGGGMMPSYRCKYPDAPPPVGTAEAFEACSTDAPCVEGLVCNGGGFGGGQGYCTLACVPQDDDCSEVADAAGDLTPECTAGFGGPGGGGMGRCTLDCAENEDGCPDGLSCIAMGGGGPGGSRCGVAP